MNMGFFEQPEIMFSPIRKGQADNLPILEVYQHFRFQCVLFFLPQIVPSLLFGGRSTGDSVASTRITSYSILAQERLNAVWKLIFALSVYRDLKIDKQCSCHTFQRLMSDREKWVQVQNRASKEYAMYRGMLTEVSGFAR